MAKKYTSPLTAKLTPSNWQENLNLNALSLDDVSDLIGDFKEMAKFGNQMAGYLKEAVRAKMPEGETEYVGRHYALVFNHRVRAGSLNKDLILEEMGEEWVEAHSNPPTEYDELRVTRVEPGEEVE